MKKLKNKTVELSISLITLVILLYAVEKILYGLSNKKSLINSIFILIVLGIFIYFINKQVREELNLKLKILRKKFI